MVRPIVQHMAALTSRAEVLQPVVGRVAVKMGRREHDAGYPELGGVHKIGAPCHAPSAVAPGRCLPVEPPAVRQAADEGEMWSPTASAPTSGALEADIAAQFTPVRWIERPQLRADRHGYRALLARTR